MCRSKKTSKPRVTGLCEGNSPVTGEFPAQKVSNAENVFNWWRHHAFWGNPPLTGGYPSQKGTVRQRELWCFLLVINLIKLLNKQSIWHGSKTPCAHMASLKWFRSNVVEKHFRAFVIFSDINIPQLWIYTLSYVLALSFINAFEQTLVNTCQFY